RGRGRVRQERCDRTVDGPVRSHIYNQFVADPPSLHVSSLLLKANVRDVVPHIPHPLGGDRRIFPGAFLARPAIPSSVMLLSHERSCPQRLRPWRVVWVSFCRRSKRIKSNICPS